MASSGSKFSDDYIAKSRRGDLLREIVALPLAERIAHLTLATDETSVLFVRFHTENLILLFTLVPRKYHPYRYKVYFELLKTVSIQLLQPNFNPDQTFFEVFSKAIRIFEKRRKLFEADYVLETRLFFSYGLLFLLFAPVDDARRVEILKYLLPKIGDLPINLKGHLLKEGCGPGVSFPEQDDPLFYIPRKMVLSLLKKMPHDEQIFSLLKNCLNKETLLGEWFKADIVEIVSHIKNYWLPKRSELFHTHYEAITKVGLSKTDLLLEYDILINLLPENNLKPKIAELYLERGMLIEELGNFEQVKDDYNKYADSRYKICDLAQALGHKARDIKVYFLLCDYLLASQCYSEDAPNYQIFLKDFQSLLNILSAPNSKEEFCLTLLSDPEVRRGDLLRAIAKTIKNLPDANQITIFNACLDPNTALGARFAENYPSFTDKINNHLVRLGAVEAPKPGFLTTTFSRALSVFSHAPVAPFMQLDDNSQSDDEKIDGNYRL